MSDYHIHSSPAIIGGAFAALGSCALLLADVGSFSALTVDKALMPVLVGLTVLAGHLAWQATHELRMLSAAGLALVATIGIALTVTDAMGRRAEVRDIKTSTASYAQQERSRLARLSAESVEILATHRAARDRECASGKGKLCDGKSYTVATWEAAVTGYEAKLAKLPSSAPVDAKGERVGALAGLFGYSPARVQTGFRLLEPFMLPALLELASIALFGFGIRHVAGPTFPVASPVFVASPVSLVSASRETTLSKETTQPPRSLPVVRSTDEDRIIAVLQRMGGEVYSQRLLGQFLGVSPGEVSKMLGHCGHCGKIERVKVDNRHVVRLVRSSNA